MFREAAGASSRRPTRATADPGIFNARKRMSCECDAGRDCGERPDPLHALPATGSEIVGEAR
jgi:hypothetical protein